MLNEMLKKQANWLFAYSYLHFIAYMLSNNTAQTAVTLIVQF